MSLKTVHRFGLALSAMFFGLAVLAVSLIVTSQVISSGGQSAGARKFYFAGDILPDHVLYPMFMAFDRFKLETASPEEQVLLELVYAQRRFAHAQEILKQGDEDLAVSTFSKSQKYLLSASQRASQLDLEEHQKKQLHDLILTQSQKMQVATEDCTDAHKSALKQLIAETEIASKSLGE